MYELVKLGEKTYFVDSPTRVGIYKLNDTDVCLIDSGNSDGAGKKVLGICTEQGWNIKYIINTHAHADHVGGNAVIQGRTGCKILCAGRDLCLVNHPTLNNSYCYGGMPPKELCNKFMLAQKSQAEELTPENIPQGLSFQHFDGHSFEQVAIICDDGTCFTGDILCGRDTIEKYHIFFIQNVGEYIKSCEKLSELDAKVYCAAHYAPIYNKEELLSLAQFNLQKLKEMFETVKKVCRDGACFDAVLKGICDEYSLELSFNQYAIAGSTVRGFLSYLHDAGELSVEFKDNYLLWKTER